MSHEEPDAIYDRIIPSANRVLYDIALSNPSLNAPTEVDFNKSDRAPLLMIAFEHDHVVPPKADPPQRVEVQGGHGRVHRVPRPAALPRRAGLGGGRRLRRHGRSGAAAGRHAESAPSA